MNDYYLCYIWINEVNDKGYVGISTDVIKRWHRHQDAARNGSDLAFHRAIKKYGPDNFRVLNLASSLTLEEAKEMEIEMIRRWNTYANTGHGYNMTYGGGGIWGYK